MATKNGKQGGDDLFDDFEDFFKQGEAGTFQASWEEEGLAEPPAPPAEPPAEPAAEPPAEPPVDAAGAHPPQELSPLQGAEASPPVEAPPALPAAPPIDVAAEPALPPAPPRLPPSPFLSPPPVPRAPAPAAVTPPLLPPPARPNDAALFQAPTLILNHDDDFDPPAPPPIAPVPPPVRVDPPAPPPAAELLFSPDEDAFFAPAPAAAVPPPVAPAPPPAAAPPAPWKDEDDEGGEADLVDWGPDTSLVMRRPPGGRGPLRPFILDEDAALLDAPTMEAPLPPVEGLAGSAAAAPREAESAMEDVPVGGSSDLPDGEAAMPAPADDPAADGPALDSEPAGLPELAVSPPEGEPEPPASDEAVGAAADAGAPAGPSLAAADRVEAAGEDDAVDLLEDPGAAGAAPSAGEAPAVGPADLLAADGAALEPELLPELPADDSTEVALPAPTVPPALLGPALVPAPILAPPETRAVEVRARPVPTGREVWLEVVRSLERAAAATEGAARASLEAEAGRVRLARLADLPAAAAAFARAVAAGVSAPALWADYADVAAELGEHELLRDLLVRRAQQVHPTLAAELLQDAALVERRHLGREQAAVDLTERSLSLVEAQAGPEAWFGLRVLRELHHRAGRWGAAAQAVRRMVALAPSGPIAAGLWFELGQLREAHLDDVDGAIEAFTEAHALTPADSAAFAALERCLRAVGDLPRLAGLYEAEAARCPEDEGGLWLLRAARVRSEGDDLDAADAAWRAAVAAAGAAAPEVRREHEAWMRAHGRMAQLAAALRADVDAQPHAALAAWSAWRLGAALEHEVGDPEGALAAYLQAVSLDPTAGPAAEAAGRLLERAGRTAERVALLRQRAAVLSDPNQIVSALLRVAELSVDALGDPAGARAALEQILDVAPGYVPALEGLERAYARLGEWGSLAALYEQRALLSEDPAPRAAWLVRAATTCELRLVDAQRALGFYQDALASVPDDESALDGASRLLEDAGDWAGLARALSRAAEVTRDGSRLVSLTYRVARLHADRTGDLAAARAALHRCLDLSPGFLPAASLMRQLAVGAGDWSAVVELDRREAELGGDPDRRRWQLLAAADAARRAGADAEPLLAAAGPGSEAVDAARELLALEGGDATARAQILQRRVEAGGADRAAFLAEWASLAGDRVLAASALRTAADRGAATGTLLRLAEGLSERELALELAARLGPAGAVDRARLLELGDADLGAALAAWAEAAEQEPLRAAPAMERLATRLGDRPRQLAAHRMLAASGFAPLEGVHSLLAGRLTEDESPQVAEGFYASALARSQTRGKAFAALRRLRVAAADLDGLRALFAGLPDVSPADLAEAFEDAGLHRAAADAWSACLDRLEGVARLPALLRLERALVGVGDWRAVFGVLGERSALAADDAERAELGARRRWVLAEHLAGTDEAWEFYRRLHAEAPNDPEVLEALARISGARGESAQAVQYLEGLAASTADAPTAARYHRRIAEVCLRTDDLAGARAAFAAALAAHPEDAEALAGLVGVARRLEDWPALADALRRELPLLAGDERLARLRELARLWEDQIGDVSVAMDSWRRVLEAAPGDLEALEQLLRLARDVEDWPAFVDVGQSVVGRLHGAPRTALLLELGQACLRRLYREEDAVRWLDQASTADPPSREAGQQLERIYAARGDWTQVVGAVLRQARAVEGADRVDLLLRVAELRLENLQDRPGASDAYAEVLRVDPQNPTALHFQGDHLFQSGDLDGAAQVFEQMELGQEARDLDDFDEKIEVALYFFRFAETLRRLDRAEGAVRRYEKSLEHNPGHLPSLEAVGPLYMAMERWDDAMRVYRQLLQLTGGQGDPERLARTYTNLGHVELRLGNHEKAKKRFNKALELRPNDIRALQGIAGVLLDRGDWNNLLNVYNNIIYHAQEPAEVVDAYLTKGFVLDARMNLPDKAAQHYRKSLAFDPSQPRALLRLAELSLRQNDWLEATSGADRGLALPGVSGELEALLQLVRYISYDQAGEVGLASAAWARAAAADPGLADRYGTTPPGGSRAHDLLRTRLHERL